MSASWKAFLNKKFIKIFKRKGSLQRRLERQVFRFFWLKGPDIELSGHRRAVRENFEIGLPSVASLIQIIAAATLPFQKKVDFSKDTKYKRNFHLTF